VIYDSKRYSVDEVYLGLGESRLVKQETFRVAARPDAVIESKVGIAVVGSIDSWMCCYHIDR